MDEVLQVEGSHKDVGQQIGTACKEAIRRATSFNSEQLPEGRTLDDQLALAAQYRKVTEEAFPWILTELDAAADASGVASELLFAASVEEIWPGRDTTARVPTPAFRGCTDIAASHPATGDGTTLIGHNNDLPASVRRDVAAIEWRVEGQPTVFSIGIALWLSVAWNATGLSVTGNELAPNDEKIGVPRLLLMTAAARARSIEEAHAIVSHKRRASSYNWLLADGQGRVSSIEGSATAAAEIGTDSRGFLHHENHYQVPEMQKYERSALHAARSAIRGARVSELLDGLEANRVSSEQLRAVLSDHKNAPESICRHAESEHDMETLFWVIAEPGRLQVEYGLGHPCDSDSRLYRFN